MNERPVRLTISDDLRRGHGSVLFRVWFALPFMLWLGVWSIAALVVAIVNWVATLVLGRSPRPLHGFLARYVRYATHVYVYLNLVAEPLPGFDGKPGYPIDVEIAPPGPAEPLGRGVPPRPRHPGVAPRHRPRRLWRQCRTATFYPALGFSRRRPARRCRLSRLVFALARGRMPRGLRDLVAYALSYGAQLWAYLLLLTDRYPSSDPLTAIGPLPARADPVRLEAGDDLRRSRLTVFFRLLLAVPHLVWLSLWGIAALARGDRQLVRDADRRRLAPALHRFLAAYVRYQVHVAAYLYLVGNPFPGFTGAEGTYPIELRVAGRDRQNRWTRRSSASCSRSRRSCSPASTARSLLVVAAPRLVRRARHRPDAARPAQCGRPGAALHGPDQRLPAPA